MKLTSKLLPSLLLAFSSLTFSLFLIKNPSDAQQTNGRFIVNSLSGKCIDVAGLPGTSNGTALILHDCELSGRDSQGGATDQKWVLTTQGFIRNTLSGKCIDVAGLPGTSNGTALILHDCELSGRDPFQGGATDQKWVLTTQGFIKNTLSGKCIDVDGLPGTSNGAKLQLFDCELSGRDPFQGRSTDQRWRLN